jgi:hypothetical protein
MREYINCRLYPDPLILAARDSGIHRMFVVVLEVLVWIFLALCT